MARARDDHLWALAHAEAPAALANDLLPASMQRRWRRGMTPCAGEWDVEQVVAHLTMLRRASTSGSGCAVCSARVSRPDVHNQRRLIEHCGSTPAETLDRFRAVITSTTAPSSHTPAYLGEVVVHAQDIRQPLGLVRTPSLDALTPVAKEFLRPARTSPWPAVPMWPICSCGQTTDRLPQAPVPWSPDRPSRS